MNKLTNISSFLLLIVFFPSVSDALTPVARWDVVPFQRISTGEVFNLGIVAFSKDGIDRVEFNITGQGYSGSNPLKSTNMTLNQQTNVWEYWVPINGDSFVGDGPVTVEAVVIGKDGGTRDLDPINLIVNKTGKLPQLSAWVSNEGNDLDGIVGSESNPFLTISAAASALQRNNGGTLNGCIIYLNDGSYAIGNLLSTRTTNEWLTIVKASNAKKEKVIINSGNNYLPDNLMVKFSGLSFVSKSQYDYVFNNNTVTLWIDDCKIIGFNRYVRGSSPITSGSNSYYTNTYIYNVDRAIGSGTLARGIVIEKIGEDAFQNFPFLVNIRLNDQDPGETLWHADGYQSWGEGPENRIIYNFIGKNMHYQGLFLRATISPGSNNAYVNIFMEMREPGRPGVSEGIPVLDSGALYGPWNHVLMWHCTFPNKKFYIRDDTVGYGFKNSSFVGNFFYELLDYEVPPGAEPAYSNYKNTDNNDFLYNHFVRSYTDVYQCSGNPQPEGCPTWYSKSPDSGNPSTQTTGGRYAESNTYLDLNDPSSDTFGYPKNGSILLNRIPFAVVPADAKGIPRLNNSDIGAFEKIEQMNTLTKPNQFRLL